uniref:Uncharacterized protein n=1 Tax=Plectus sambesii TaxID=2011161 RepID=A0A914UI28_9BILA
MRTGPDGLRPASSAAHRSLQRRLGAFNSTRVGLITIGVSASLIYAIYFFLAPTTSKDYVTAGKTVPNELKPEMLKQLIEELGLDRPVLVSPSMSGAYAMPFFMQWPKLIRAFIAIAPVNSGDYSADDYGKNELPTLIVYGERDTSLGVSSASNMKVLPNGRVVKIPSAGHACYLNNPEVFHTACLNFLDLVRTHSKR